MNPLEHAARDRDAAPAEAIDWPNRRPPARLLQQTFTTSRRPISPSRPNRRAMHAALGRRARSNWAGTIPLVIDGRRGRNAASDCRRVDPSHKQRVVGTLPRPTRPTCRTTRSRRPRPRCRAGPHWASRTGPSFSARPPSDARAPLRAGRLGSLRMRQGLARSRRRRLRGDRFLRILRPAGARADGAPHGVDVPGEENRFFYLPRGVAAVIAPWNFPLAILTGMTAAALVDRQHGGHEAGRAVVGHRRLN